MLRWAPRWLLRPNGKAQETVGIMIVGPIFRLAGRSVSRQRTFRRLMVLHVLVISITCLLATLKHDRYMVETIGFTLLIAGIVEGALVLGWRLTQLPKSQSLEALLLSPVASPQVMLGEQLVGLTQFTFLSFSSLPVMALMVAWGQLTAQTLGLLVMTGYTWGLVTGFGLCWWAYEPRRVRWWGERAFALLIVVYLVVGLLAGEKFGQYLVQLPGDVGHTIREGLLFVHFNNPFQLIHRLSLWPDQETIGRFWFVELLALIAVTVFLLRAAGRLKGHYLDENYRPHTLANDKGRGTPGDHPLSWWAKRRVMRYSGKMNLYLAMGVSVLYSVYLLDWLPSWVGRNTFIVLKLMGGMEGLAAAMMVLAAVPAAYQYGLWDSSVPEKCRRLELLLLSDLNARDFLHASVSASWYRGKGYYLAGLLLWIVGMITGECSIAAGVLAITAGTLLILLYFSLAFRNFATNRGGTTVGFLLCMVVPVMTWAFAEQLGPFWARLLPPGLVFYAPRTDSLSAWIQSLVLVSIMAGAVVILMRQALRTFDRELRAWYDAHQGQKV